MGHSWTLIWTSFAIGFAPSFFSALTAKKKEEGEVKVIVK